MAKYDSFHFSPCNDRTILMPRHDKRIPLERPARPMRMGKRAFTQDGVNPDAPYAPVNLGIFHVDTQINGIPKHYAVYVPASMTSKGFALLLFLPSHKKAEEALLEGWQDIADRQGVTLLMMENEWNREELSEAFDYAQDVIDHQFQRREITDIGEATIYPYGEGDAAGIATAYALVYSATYPAFAADGDCSIDPALLDLLNTLPSDGIDGLPKKNVPLPGVLIDRKDNAQPVADYIRQTLCADDDGLSNTFAHVYLQKAYRGQHFINEQAVGQLWYATPDTVGEQGIQTLRMQTVSFLKRFSRWGGYGNCHLRRTRLPEDVGIRRVWKNINGYKRFWDVYVPSYYRADEQKKYPLVLAIHGFSCNASYFEQTSDWDRVAEERGFIVVFASAYPQKSAISGYALPAWDCIGNGGLDEIPYFTQLLDETIAEYNIDTERVYAVGHSNGGMATFMLMDKMPERFAAFGPTGSLVGMVQQENFLSHGILCPVYNMVGEYDLFGAQVNTPEDGAWQSINKLCALNKATFNNENWYDNGRYHTLVLYDAQHRPVVRYTEMKGCPHTYTPGMSELTWDDFLCHYSRKADGSIEYKG